MKWSPKRSWIKALCYFYKPKEVNPRDITTISLTTCFSNKCPKRLKRKSRQEMENWLTSQHLSNSFTEIYLTESSEHPEEAELRGHRTKCKGQSAVRTQSAILLVCFFSAHRDKPHNLTHTHTDRLNLHLTQLNSEIKIIKIHKNT